MKYICTICGYVYDEAKEGTPFAKLPESWVCPLCGADTSAFKPEGETGNAKTPVKPVHIDENMKKLSAGELAAVFSNLALGCEKQYNEEASALLSEIADYFTSVTPSVPDADIEQLAELIRNDLEEGYPDLEAAAVTNADRGTHRICVWGGKSTNILNSLLKRWEKEGDAFLQDTEVWVCTVCGFIFVDDCAPEICPVCKVPAWKFEKIEGRASI
ncbi:MAG: rubredoxin-like domain-containing protein [Lentihominibacter sp.]|jgi:NADP-reducing hydrogenase subunit HndD